MVCIYCSGPTRVTNSRHQKRGNGIWRRRQCLQCNATFTSREQVDLSETLRIAKQTQSPKLVPFLRDRLFLDIYASCGHRATALADASALTQTIVDVLLHKHKNGLVTHEDVISATLTALKHFDATAATFYRAYHPTIAKQFTL